MDTKEKIKNLIKENDVVYSWKELPGPQCGFSMAVSNVLKHIDIKFLGVNVLEDEKLRQEIKEFSDWLQFHNSILREFIGGCDIVKEMFETGELKIY